MDAPNFAQDDIKNKSNCRPSADEVDVDGMWDDSALVAEREEFADGFASVVAVVQGALVDVHSDEFVGEDRIEVAGELHGVFECFVAVFETVLDAVAQSVRDGEHEVFAEGAADGVASERKRQAGLFAPPLTEVDDFVQAAMRVGELAFVDD